MKKTTLYLALLALVIFSCKKESTPTTNPINEPILSDKIVRIDISDHNNNLFATFKYDSLGRVDNIKYHQLSNQTYDEIDFMYGNNILFLGYKSDTMSSNHDFVDSFVCINQLAQYKLNNDDYDYKLFYDQNQFLSSVYLGTGSIDFEKDSLKSDGVNITYLKNIKNNVQSYDTAICTNFAYYMDSIDNIHTYYENLLPVFSLQSRGSYFGKASKNLLKSFTVYSSKTKASRNLKITYELDNRKNPTKINLIEFGNILKSNSIKYHYGK